MGGEGDQRGDPGDNPAKGDAGRDEPADVGGAEPASGGDGIDGYARGGDQRGGGGEAGGDPAGGRAKAGEYPAGGGGEAGPAFAGGGVLVGAGEDLQRGADGGSEDDDAAVFRDAEGDGDEPGDEVYLPDGVHQFAGEFYEGSEVAGIGLRSGRLGGALARIGFMRR